MKIFYITYISMENTTSGSSVRPVMMYKAMLELGHDVYLVKGDQSHQGKKNRQRNVQQAREWLRNNKPDICYIESPTYPIMHSFDRRLIKEVTDREIPTAYFYRDFHLKFPHFRKENKRSISRLVKDTYLLILQRITDKLLNRVDIVYFPTMKAAEYFRYSNMKQLMPAGKYRLVQRELDKKVCIYVGGLSDMYGPRLLYESFTILNNNSRNPVYELILVCREAEYSRSVFSLGNQTMPNWLHVHHVSGSDKLENLYRKAAVALLPLKPTEYINMAIAVKFFEYLGEGLPIVSAGAYEMSKLIRENNLGIVTEHSPEAFAAGIRLILSERDKYAGYINSISSFMSRNQWTDRVNQIVCDLCRMKDSVQAND